MRECDERLRKFLTRELFRRLADFNCLRDSNPKVFRLFDYAPRRHFVCFRCVNQVQAKDIFLRARAHVKAIAVICRIWNYSAILEDNAIFRSAACAIFNMRCANNCKGEKSDLAAQVPEARNREVASGSLTPHHNHAVWSRAKCAAYVATMPPKMLPAMTSLTK